MHNSLLAMAQIIVEDLDPVVIEKLEALAKEHGRSLQAELKYILEAAAQAQTLNQPEKLEVAKTPEELGWTPAHKALSVPPRESTSQNQRRV